MCSVKAKQKLIWSRVKKIYWHLIIFLPPLPYFTCDLFTVYQAKFPILCWKHALHLKLHSELHLSRRGNKHTENDFLFHANLVIFLYFFSPNYIKPILLNMALFAKTHQECLRREKQNKTYTHDNGQWCAHKNQFDINIDLSSLSKGQKEKHLIQPCPSA